VEQTLALNSLATKDSRILEKKKPENVHVMSDTSLMTFLMLSRYVGLLTSAISFVNFTNGPTF
jgi:hypothetical protein